MEGGGGTKKPRAYDETCICSLNLLRQEGIPNNIECLHTANERQSKRGEEGRSQQQRGEKGYIIQYLWGVGGVLLKEQGRH